MSLQIGDSAPDFSLKGTQSDDPVSLTGFAGSKSVVVLFFPLAWTGVCTKEMCGIRDNHAQYEDLEAQVIAHEGGIDPATANDLARLGTGVRNLRHHGFEEGVSTRLLVYAAQLISGGIPVRRACEVAVSTAITDDPEVQSAVSELVSTLFS